MSGPIECCGVPMTYVEIPNVYDGALYLTCEMCGKWQHRFDEADTRRQRGYRLNAFPPENMRMESKFVINKVPVTISADDFEHLALMGMTKDGRYRVGEGGAERVLAHAKKLVGGREVVVDNIRVALQFAMSALPDSETAGPDGTGYRYAWDELTGDEQEWVKEIRHRVAILVPPEKS